MASARPRRASKRPIAGFGNTGRLSATEQKGKECHDQDKQAQEGQFWVRFWYLPEIDMILGDGVGTSLIRCSYCQLDVGLMRFYIGTAQLKKVLGWA